MRCDFPNDQIRIDPVRAEGIAQNASLELFNNQEVIRAGELPRRYSEIDTATEYLYVTAMADVPDMTGVSAETIRACRTLEELLDVIVEAFMAELVLTECFQVMDIADDIRTMEIPLAEFGGPSIVDVDEERPRDDLAYETIDFELRKWVLRSFVGGNWTRRSLFENFQELLEQIRRRLFEVFPEPETFDAERTESILDAYATLESEHFMPDRAFIGADPSTLSDSLGHDVSSMSPSLYGMELTQAPGLDGSEFIIVDSDHFGYECVWEAASYDYFTDLDTFGREFEPFTVEFTMGKEWVCAYDEALVYGRAM